MTSKTSSRMFADDSSSPRVLVFARTSTGRELINELQQCGVRAVLADGGDASGGALRSPEAGVDAIEAAQAELGHIDAMIYGWVDPVMAERQPVADMTEEMWIAKCEQPLLYSRNFFELAHNVLHTKGGNIVMLLPSLSMTGAGELVPWASAAEGQRSLAKATARAWGRYPIRINSIAVAAGLLAGLDTDYELDRAGLPGPSLAPSPARWTGVAQLLATMLSPGFGLVTGTTIGADNGRWMTP